jgi:two-component system, OmpR family, phosphate regulon sensor histidine kinase PhoR
MDVLSSQAETDPVAEVRRLRRQLRRERALRQTAETVGARATAHLHDSVRGMRSAQAELLERADQDRVVDELAQALREDLDSAHLVNRAAESVGRSTQVDRCDVLLVDADRFSAVRGTWSASAEMEALPRPGSFVDLPEPLTTLLLEAAQQLEPVHIDDVDRDERLGAEGAHEVVASLGVHSLAAVPVAVGDEVVGWLLLQSLRPRTWQASALAMCAGLAHDLVSSLMQLRAYEQERESVRRLQELDRAKDAFVSTVSHGLRTPLTSIVGYLELIDEGGLGPVPDDVSQGLSVIERNVGRLRELVEDLLTLSAYDAEQVRLEIEPLDVSGVLRDSLLDLQESADDRGLDVVVTTQADLPRVLADPTHLERVLQNLLSNAIKFSHDGDQVVVRLREEGSEVVLAITDTGIGIPDDEQDQLFSRFFRSSLAVEEEIQGTGLGLALVRAVVEWHGGSVDVESVEGEGTTVTVRLPSVR